jgi:hypothetical protein
LVAFTPRGGGAHDANGANGTQASSAVVGSSAIRNTVLVNKSFNSLNTHTKYTHLHSQPNSQSTPSNSH